MTSVFFLFTGKRSFPPRHDWILALVKVYVRRMLRAPGSILWIAFPLLLLLFARRGLAATADHFRRQHPVDGAEIERRRLRPADDHGRKCRSAGNRSSASCARLTRNNCTPTGRKSKRIGATCSGRRDQGLLHSRRTRSLAAPDGAKSPPAARDRFPGRAPGPREARLRRKDSAARLSAPASPCSTNCRRSRRGAEPIPDWRKQLPANLQLVVPGRSLFRARSAAHRRLRHHQRAGRDARAKGNAGARSCRSPACR